MYIIYTLSYQTDSMCFISIAIIACLIYQHFVGTIQTSKCFILLVLNILQALACLLVYIITDNIKYNYMKKSIIFIISLACLSAGLSGSQYAGPEQDGKNTDAVTVASSPGLKALAQSWIDAYRVENPGRNVSMLPVDEYNKADIRIFEGASAGTASGESEWKMVVARDVIVPVMSTDNPFYQVIMSKGIAPEKFGALLSSPTVTWGKILGTEANVPAMTNVAVDGAALGYLAGFAGIDASQVIARELPVSEIASLLRNQPATVVFCKLSDITAPGGTGFAENLMVVPIDINSNGQSDYFEQFYADFNSFNRGVYIGKYPKELCNSIFCATASQMVPEAAADFIRWILADGQEIAATSGLTALSGSEGMIRREMLTPVTEIVQAGNENKAGVSILVWVMAVISAISLLGFLLYRITRAGKGKISLLEEEPLKAFSPKTFVTPAGILFDKSHTWAFMEKNGTVTVGIDDFLQHVTGTVTRITLKATGEKVRKGERIASLIQKGKQLDILSPVSGTVVSRNESLANNTDLLHSGPYSEGWMYGIEPDNWFNESRLMAAADKFAVQLREEFGRIRDFLATVAGANDMRLAHVVLQDGGELKEGFLEEFGPEVWEEFQIRFINRS